MVMKSNRHEDIVGEKKERIADRLKRIEDNTAMLKEIVGIRD
jgi:hypothetical protein